MYHKYIKISYSIPAADNNVSTTGSLQDPLISVVWFLLPSCDVGYVAGSLGHFRALALEVLRYTVKFSF